MDQPKWLNEAWRELGQCERPGSADNPRIVALYRDAGHAEIRHDEIAWCAAFTGACLTRAGQSGSGSLMARSYLNWGVPIDEPRIGSIAIISRGSNAALGHVGFLIGETAESIILLGGNQGDAVSVAAFPRARLLGLRWPGAKPGHRSAPDTGSNAGSNSGYNSGPSPASQDTHFAAALAHVLQMEGGYTDDPYDPGGPTNKGITLRVLAEWKSVTVDAASVALLKDDLKRIPDTVVSDIYRARYWRPAHCSELPPALALMHFDASVNHGVGTAGRMLQQALGVAVDGEIGPDTLRAAAASNLKEVLAQYAALRRDRYRALSHFWRFGRGWLARVNTTLGVANSLLPAPLNLQQKGQTPMTNVAATAPPDGIANSGPKWWGRSMTIWGAVMTGLAALLPALASISGVNLSPDLIREASSHLATAVQAVMALCGTVMTIYGRVRANHPLERREMSLRI